MTTGPRPPVGDGDAAPTGGSAVEVLAARDADVAGLRVRRALPRHGRRTVGAWCFADHFGPVVVGPEAPVSIGPHPHIGLQTVTWLLDGEQRHRDSLGSDQRLRPGQLNLMTAGRGVAHAEESLGFRGRLHGVQLWVALPDAARRVPPAFEQVDELPTVGLTNGVGTVLVGSFGGATSPARTHTPLVGVDLRVRSGTTTVALDPGFEHAVLVIDGAIGVDDHAVVAGALAVLGAGRHQVVLRSGGNWRAMLLGGTPFGEPVLMWWNFVARTREEVADAREAWAAADGRFGRVDSGLDPVPAPGLPWAPARRGQLDG